MGLNVIFECRSLKIANYSHQAIDLMMKNTGLDRKIAEEEIDRYCAIPGQACAYKVFST